MLNIELTRKWIETDLLLELVENELDHDVVLHFQHLVDSLGDPRLQDVDLDFGHVDLLDEIILKFHGFQQLLLLVRKPVVLVRTGALQVKTVRSIFLITISASYSEESSISHGYVPVLV